MKTNNDYFPVGIFATMILSLIAYFYYGESLSGCLVVLLMGLLFGLISVVGLIPIIGPVLYWVLTYYWLYPLLLSWAGISPSWITVVILFCGFVVSMILSYFTTMKMWEK